MEGESPPTQPYRPSRIHQFYNWIDRLPGPYWLYYLGVVVIVGLLNHLVARREHVVASGTINWYYALTAVFLGFHLFQIDFLLRVSRDTLVEFLPILDVSETERDRIMFEFTHLPARPTAIAFVFGMATGLGLAVSILPTAVEMNSAFPALEVPVKALSSAVGLITVYMVTRAFVLTKRVYELLSEINIFDLGSLYAMSRYSAWLLVLSVLQTYLVVALNPSLVSLGYYSVSLTLLVLVMAALAFLIFWLPVRRVNRILTLEKRRLLKEVSFRIETTFNLLHARVDRQEFRCIVELRETLQSLVIGKEFIESLRTWPWERSTLTGLLSVFVLPLVVGLAIEIVSKFIPF
jgi:hypothetical protein